MKCIYYKCFWTVLSRTFSPLAEDGWSHNKLSCCRKTARLSLRNV